MGRQTTLWLLLAAALAAAAVWWQRGREVEGTLGRIDVALFEGIDVERVRALRVDHLERGIVAFERDGRGSWIIVDPIAYPADEAVMRVLLDAVARSRAVVVAAPEADPEALGLSPPRAVLVLEEQTDAGPREHRLELGTLDLDGRSVNVRSGGRILRTLRTIHTTLERSVDDYRSRRLLEMLPNSIVSLARSGSVQHDDGEAAVPLGLSAVMDGGHWTALTPHAARLDPLEVSVITVGAATMRIESFVDDDEPDLGRYGLAEPTFSLELGNAAGLREVLHFGRTARKSDRWFACREGWPHVWRLSTDQILRLVVPFDVLLDRRLLRVDRSAVDAVVWDDGARVVRLERAADGWRGRVDEGAVFAADTARVEDVLSRLEQAELLGFDLARRPTDAALDQTLLIEAGGRRLGGRLGQDVEEGPAGTILAFRRFGDDVLGLAEPWLGELLAASADSWRSLELLTVEEVGLSGLTLRRGQIERSFVRDERGRWSPAGEQREATGLLAVLDPLLFLRAARFSEVADAPVGVVEVILEHRDGARTRVAIGRDRSGASAALVGGRTAVLSVGDLHARLGRLLGE
ncbi:MAG: DUF4340 domain-containing protein [Planctomycetota bacterium]|jgi:hypothetical protein|nr:DUF4340 domain-containing protein [Planctomycetota bacterium]MDP6762947.1 DUF4340 domain-containing protein [Planctomycetota bacterium]MDP6987873.1 DUF4340 domain-containing protein [Planctomycetota bacterium]